MINVLVLYRRYTLTRQPQKKLALVTGASRGIGAGIAKELANAGTHVILLARTIGSLEEIDDEIKKNGGSSTIVAMDLLDYSAIDRLGASIFERWGKLDILIGNAAVLGQLTPIHHYDPTIWDEVIGVNLTANYRLLRSLDPLLRISEKGRIIFLSSDVSDGLHPYWGAYAVSKSALETMVSTYAKETERLALQINIVDPGPTGTKLRAGAFPGENQRQIQTPEIAAQFICEVIFNKETEHGAIVKR